MHEKLQLYDKSHSIDIGLFNIAIHYFSIPSVPKVAMLLIIRPTNHTHSPFAHIYFIFLKTGCTYWLFGVFFYINYFHTNHITLVRFLKLIIMAILLKVNCTKTILLLVTVLRRFSAAKAATINYFEFT